MLRIHLLILNGMGATPPPNFIAHVLGAGIRNYPADLSGHRQGCHGRASTGDNWVRRGKALSIQTRTVNWGEILGNAVASEKGN